MDSTAPPAQSQPVPQPTRVQPPIADIPIANPTAPVQVTGSANKEAGPVQNATVEAPVPAEQAKPVEQAVELAPSVPEVAIEKSIEHVVEKSPDAEKPDLPKEVQAAGVTLSGPGIPVNENTFGVTKMPMTYQQAVAEEKIHPKLNDSKHWLVELVEYVWRKLDPTIGKKDKKK